jgi:hypothetical protein
VAATCITISPLDGGVKGATDDEFMTEMKIDKKREELYKLREQRNEPKTGH